MSLPVLAHRARVIIPMLFLLLVSAKYVPPVLFLPLTLIFSASGWRLDALERSSRPGFLC